MGKDAALDKRKVIAYGREFLVTAATDETKFLTFLSKVNFDGPNGCWLWTGDTRRGDYAVFNYKKHETPAYRFAHEALVGPIPDGYHIHHKIEEPVLCVGPLCVHAPDHLAALSPAEHLIQHGKKPRRATYERFRRKLSMLCPEGHLMYRYVFPDGHVQSRCRECLREARKLRYAELREENPTRQMLNICHKGHVFTKKTTGYLASGGRICKICRDARAAKWRAANDARLEAFNAARRKGLSREETAARETCANGHPWTEESTAYVNGYKRCRICVAAATMRVYEKKKAAQPTHGRQPKTHCTKGHAIEGDNIYVNPRGTNECRACRNAASKAAKDRLKAERGPIEPKETCIHGHALTPDNVYIDKANGGRHCKTCVKGRAAEAKAAKREEKAAAASAQDSLFEPEPPRAFIPPKLARRRRGYS